MRLRLTLKPIHKNTIIPINYQYQITSWFYRLLNSGDKAFGKKLHNEGYSKDGKHRYKLFTFSHLDIKDKKIFDDRIQIFSDQIEFVMSFIMDETPKVMLIGLFNNKTMEIADSKSKGEFFIERIDPLSEPKFSQTMRFRTISPICLSKKTSKGTPEYLSPDYPEYSEQFFKHLLHKYNSLNPEYQIKQKPSFVLLNKPHSRLITFKAGTERESKVRGYNFNFEINADEELIRFGYYSGFGEKNSSGFGCVSCILNNLRIEKKYGCT